MNGLKKTWFNWLLHMEVAHAPVCSASHRLVVYTVAVRKSQARTRERTRLGLTGLVR